MARVLFVTPWYPSPEHVYNGVFVREHAKAARVGGNEVVVLHVVRPARGQRPLWRLEPETDPALTDGIPTYRLRTRAVRVPGLAFAARLWSIFRAYRLIRRRGFDPEVLHAQVFGAAFQVAILGCTQRRPFVVTEHSTDFPQRRLRRVDRWKTGWAFRRAAAVLPVCRFLQDAIEAYGIKARFRIVPNTVDTAVFHPAAATPGDDAGANRGRRSRDRAERARRRLLYVGNLDHSPHKAFPVLLDALTILDQRRIDVTLDVVGDGSARLDFSERVADLGLHSCVTLHGALQKSGVAEMMRASDCLVLPSRFENLPCVIIEALASGLPVVATAVGGIPEIVTEAQGILVPPGNAAALADALARVATGSVAFDETSIAADAGSRFGLVHVGAELSEVYADAIACWRRVKTSERP